MALNIQSTFTIKRSGDVPLIQASDINNNSLNLKKVFYISNELSTLLLRSKPKQNDILFSYVGTVGNNYLVGSENIHLGSNVALIRSFKDKILPKYLYYFLNSGIFKKEMDLYIKGTTQLNIKMADLRIIKLNLPNKLEQQKIIDIIEPLEMVKTNLFNQLMSFEKYAKLISFNYKNKELLNKKCQFLKGKVVKNNDLDQTLFLNVSAANHHPNKYCNMQPNIFPGDVTLSLDGNTGLVNNNLLGFNGYLSKVWGKNIPNWQIYYSLKHEINQKIIKLNETGTTLKHSSNSKKELFLFEFNHPESLDLLFKLEIKAKQQISLINKEMTNIINLLIK